MGKETERVKIFYQKQGKLIAFIALVLSLVSSLVYLGISIGTAQEKIENLQYFKAETKADIRDIDNEIDALGLFNSKEHNDLTNDIILLHERISVLRKQFDSLEKRIHAQKRKNRL